MADWGAIKKINSDMTMPLDKLILSQRKLTPSQNELVIVDTSNQFTKNSADKTLGTFVPKISGFVNITITTNSSNDATRLNINVYENGALVFSKTPSSESKVYEYSLQIKSNNTYVFKFEKGSNPSGTLSYSKIAVCGNIVEGLMYDFIKE